MMKRSGDDEIAGRAREIWRSCGAEECSVGGWKVPDSRKDLMLDMVRRLEAEGERRMMGSLGRGLEGRGARGLGMRAGLETGGWPGRVGRVWCGREEEEGAVRRRVMKSSACFLTWEKS